MRRSLMVGLFLILAQVTLYAATVSGTVTVQGSTDPVVGAKIILASFQGGLTTDSTTTDAKGAYSFANKAVGNYTILATAPNYQLANNSVSVLSNTGTVTKNFSMRPSITPPSQTGTISGIVMDSATKELIANASVILSHSAGRNQTTPIDTVVTDGEGRFVFSAVTALPGYFLETTKMGYINYTSNNNVSVVANDTTKVTINLVKMPKPTAIILGKVSDATTKATVAGAKIVLRVRTLSQSGITWKLIDSMQSEADGSYKFDSLQGTVNTGGINNDPIYSLVTSKTDYNTFTSSNIVVANNAADTVNIAMVTITKGTINIFVGLDFAGNAPLAGASVVATQQGPGGVIYTGTTDAKGWVTIANVISSSYNVSASLSGFVSKDVVRAVGANELDTGFIYLARATAQNSKMLSGIVRDAGGIAVKGATVTFQATGGIIITVKSTATGDYSISGIPTQINGGTLKVMSTGFSDFSSPVTLIGAATDLNVTLQIPVSLMHQSQLNANIKWTQNGSNLFIEFSNASSSGSLSLYNATGKLVSAQSFSSGLSKVSISKIGLRNDFGLLLIKQGNTQLSVRVSPTP